MSYLISDYFDDIVEKYSKEIAFVDDNREISFKELKKESLVVANALISNKVYKEPVLIIMDKSIDAICAFLGCIYSGNYYSPVDTKMPMDRIKKIVNVLEPRVIIIYDKYKDLAKQISQNAIILIYEELFSRYLSDEIKVKQITKTIIDTDILYILFTSGSTGIPKGVIVNQRNVIDYIRWITDAYNLNKTNVFANQAQFYFDLSVQDIFLPIFNGSKTIIINNRLFAMPIRVWKIMLKYRVNSIMWIPSAISLFANYDIFSKVEPLFLRVVLFCGEVMPMKQLNYWIKKYPHTVFGNLYGPTECTVACAYYNVNRNFSDSDILPIGNGCGNIDIMVLDENNKLISKPGIQGELCVRGTTVSMGYYNNPEKTEEAFIQNPLNNKYKEVIYRTGDIVEYNDRQEIMYISRKDFQIKHRGYRIELGEIEAATSSIKEVMYNCCIYNEKKDIIVLVYSGDIDENHLNECLVKIIPNYMLPSEYKRLDEMLFNINGKIDRKTLKEIYCK